jgi:alpha-beta hydrolase superfamily lysophospholipase
LKKKNGPFSKSALLTQLVTGRSNKAFEPARTPFDWLSVNEENVDRYIADDLCGFEFTVGAYADFFQCLKALASGDREERIRKDLPLLIISGALDPVGGAKSCPKVLEHYRKLGLRNVTLKLYENDRHEILNEDDREQVFRDLAEWFDGI